MLPCSTGCFSLTVNCLPDAPRGPRDHPAGCCKFGVPFGTYDTCTSADPNTKCPADGGSCACKSGAGGVWPGAHPHAAEAALAATGGAQHVPVEEPARSVMPAASQGWCWRHV